MSRLRLVPVSLAVLLAPFASSAHEAGPPAGPGDHRLQAYVRCDGFAEGVRGVTLDRRPATAEPWREAVFGGVSARVSVVDGYRVMYSYARTLPFANLKAEQSDPSRYPEDKRILSRNIIEMARADAALDLAEFSYLGFSVQTLTKRELAGRSLGMTQVFSDADSVIVTVFFLNQLPEHRRFQTHEEFISLRNAFVHGYLECAARGKILPAP